MTSRGAPAATTSRSITRHADADGLAAYQVDPLHQEVVAFIKRKAPQAVAVDFES